ncbi:MAG: DotI/IcmL family type IV secretion protein [Alcanivorax sp.]
MKSVNLFFLSFCLLLSIVAFTPNAHAGWLDFLFPTQDTGPDPSQTLRAPFADEDAVIEDLDAEGNPEKAVPLHMRHRPNTVITQWVQMTVPFVLTYKAKTYEKEYGQKVVHFSKGGLDEYVKFLQGRNILKTLKTGRYNVTGILEDYPVIINEGAVDGRYLWLFKADVLVTYFDSSLKKHPVREDDPNTITQEYTITFQVGRNKGVKNEHGLLIESFEVKLKKP